MTGTPTQAQQLAAKARISGVPEHCIDGLVRWIVDGIKPGTFLCAVIRNRLVEAASYADDINRHALFAYAVFLVSYAPAGSWGDDALATWKGLETAGVDHA